MTDRRPLSPIERRADVGRDNAAPPIAFGVLMRRFRLLMGLTQEELAERAGISPHSVSDFERGITHRPQRETVRLLAEALQLAEEDRAVFEAVARGRPVTPPRLVSPTVPTHNLPTPLTSLVGRDTDVTALRALLQRSDVRLVTVTGTGGIGKTRLALDVAPSLLDDFPDGIFFVPLAAVRDPDRVLATIAQTLGIKAGARQTPREALVSHLASQRALLVLDNFEHLLDAAVSVAELLAVCTGVKALVTSRAALHVRGEYAWPVGPLALPTPDDATMSGTLAGVPAVALFVQRAEAARPDFRLTDANGAAVTALCVHLDGIPLALELAAAQLRAATPAHLLARLERRLPLLTGGARDLPARQRTMRDTIAWSYDLLPANAQHLFRTRAVFAGGWTLGAAEAVASVLGGPSGDAAEPALRSLMDHSLVQQEIHGEMVRYTMLETIREYAAECAMAEDEYDDARRAHADYFRALAEEAAPHLEEAQQAQWLDLLEADHDNLRAALIWLRETGREYDGLRLATALAQFWLVRGYVSEGEGWLRQFLALVPAGSENAATPLRAAALSGGGNLATRLGDYARAITCYEESLRIWDSLGDTGGMALQHRRLGIIAWYQGDHHVAADRFSVAMRLYQALDDTSGIAAACNNLGLIADRFGRYDEAVERYTQSLALWRGLGDVQGISNALHNLGLVAQKRLDIERANQYYTESLAARREIGDKMGIAQSLNGLGIVASLRGEYNRADALFGESLALHREIGNRSGAAHSLYHWGVALQRSGAYDRAATLYEESLVIREEIGSQVEIADSLRGLAAVASLTGDNDRAAHLLDAALPRYRSTGNTLGNVGCLETIAVIADHRGQHARAVTLLGATAAQRETLGTPRTPAERMTYDDILGRARNALGDRAFSAVWEAGQVMSLDEACDLASVDSTASPGHSGEKFRIKADRAG